MKTATARQKIRTLVESPIFNQLVLAAILITALLVGISTYPEMEQKYGILIQIIDTIIIALFSIEIILRIMAEEKPINYFKDPWNLFDFLIVAACFLPTRNKTILLLRLLRVIRTLRFFRAIPKLRVVINGMLNSLSSVWYVALMLLLQIYIFAVFGVTAFSKISPEYFGNLHTAFLTLFQVLTLENWPSVMEPIQAAEPVIGPAYFVLFISIGTMVIMNLFLGVIVNSMSESMKKIDESENPQEKKQGKEILAVKKQLDSLNKKLDEIKKEIKNI
jgi:voltage-gated sodium channel